MDYDNYIELYEAVYLFGKLNDICNFKLPINIKRENFKKINESVFKALMRIMVVNDLLCYDDKNFVMKSEHNEKYKFILNDVISVDLNKQYPEMLEKATNKSQFFFDFISKEEYEIYSRVNFQMTLNLGKKIIEYIDLNNKKILELGGNSGGLATAILSEYKDSKYTVVDSKIPCQIGNEYKGYNDIDINFVENDIFKLNLPTESYDYIIAMNLLHDFNDLKCMEILNNCIKYSNKNTKIVIIEDILFDEFEPKEVVMHGLRLSVECNGGKQRTIKEFKSLFENINYKLEDTTKISDIHTMLVISKK